METSAGRRLTLGIDIGTSTIVAALWDAEAERPARSCTLANDSMLAVAPGRAEQDPERILRTARRALESLSATCPVRVAAVACTGQMHGLLLVDERLDPLTPLLTWQDRRAESIAAEADAALEQEEPGGWVRRGCRLHPGYGGATLAWLLRSGDYSRARWACGIADWVAARLSGSLATDPSTAASWGLYSIRDHAWDEAASRTLGVPADLLPPIGETGSLLGRADLGALGKGVPLALGLGDNQASVVAALRGRAPGECCVVNVGTGSQISIVGERGEEASNGAAGLEVRPFVDGRLLHVGASPNGGAAYAALKRFFALARGQAEGGEDLYALMGSWAASVPAGTDGLICNPALFGERGSPALSGSLSGLTSRSLTPGHFCRAVLEGMARALYRLYGATGLKRSLLVGSGNAVRKNAVFREILAGTFGMPLELSAYVEEAAAGAAIVASRQAK